jgi:hypothetical protein
MHYAIYSFILIWYQNMIGCDSLQKILGICGKEKKLNCCKMERRRE